MQPGGASNESPSSVVGWVVGWVCLVVKEVVQHRYHRHNCDHTGTIGATWRVGLGVQEVVQHRYHTGTIDIIQAPPGGLVWE